MPSTPVSWRQKLTKGERHTPKERDIWVEPSEFWKGPDRWRGEQGTFWK